MDIDRIRGVIDKNPEPVVETSTDPEIMRRANLRRKLNAESAYMDMSPEEVEQAEEIRKARNREKCRRYRQRRKERDPDFRASENARINAVRRKKKQKDA